MKSAPLCGAGSSARRRPGIATRKYVNEQSGYHVFSVPFPGRFIERIVLGILPIEGCVDVDAWIKAANLACTRSGMSPGVRAALARA